MKTSTLIIGGGLTGLALAHQLQMAGQDFLLVEARDRLGGRITSLHLDGEAFDLGPSWVWPGQMRVAVLCDLLGLRLFEQHARGVQLYEHTDGQVIRDQGFMSMAGSLRIAGGTGALVDALVARLDPARLLTGAVAQRVTDDGATLQDGRTISADRIVIALPPRLAARLAFTPALPIEAQQALGAVPVWMGAHAKCVAVYDTPFWRKDGLSGDAASRRGPLAEIHDASPAQGPLGALFGFVGLPADQRAQTDLRAPVIAQLVNLFGPQAASPRALQIMDWSREAFTATTTDATPPAGHPAYLLPPALRQVADDRIIFACAELTTDNGGLIEGALAAAERAARLILPV
ncbi:MULTISPECIES: flavin monoamine oxidase family protein [unclassified Yoonia]|uniref:flavin monoamine oxidase family protein n=1 Tax=unclassified Yoonia TaxID=2629118 RepID=UPI002B0025E7|nr:MULTISPECIES: FAD-dependent oxidoreductase [unclassified Yoonia]